MAARRRRATSRSKSGGAEDLLAPFVKLIEWIVRLLASLLAAAWAELSDDHRKDLAGIGLLVASLGVVVSMAYPYGIWLAAIHAATFGLIGFGWPLAIGGTVYGAVVLIHPPAGAHIKRYQSLASVVAGVALLGLLSLISVPAGGRVGWLVSVLPNQGLGSGGAALFLGGLGLLALGFAWRPRIVLVARQLLQHPAVPEFIRTRAAGKGAPRAKKPAPIAEEPVAQDPDAEPQTMPTVDLLESPEEPVRLTAEEGRALVAQVGGVLADIGIGAKVRNVTDSPSSVLVALELAAGTRVAKLRSAMDDLRVGLGSPNLILRTPITGTTYIGLEMPRETTEIVRLRAVVEAPEFWKQSLPLALGAGAAGAPMVLDLAELPHATIGGETGSGKSVCINALLLGLVLRYGPDRLWLVLIDPKQVELAAYSELPHLALPVVTDPTQAQGALQLVAEEMDRRYGQMAAAGKEIKNLGDYNRHAERRGLPPMPYIVVVIDELADLMVVTEGEVEDTIVRLASKARAAGIHLVLATQSPRKEVMTGLIKLNVPGRIAFAVSSQIDSRVILDDRGAEALKGRGDMLVTGGPLDRARGQGAFPSKADTKALIDFWTATGPPGYFLSPELATGLDPMFARAARKVAGGGRSASTAVFAATLQGALDIRPARAARIVDQLVEHGVIAKGNGARPREVLMGGAEVDELLEQLGVEG
jgi:DNA segregation ATPase FtsK/SpoIIIE-like protein